MSALPDCSDEGVVFEEDALSPLLAAIEKVWARSLEGEWATPDLMLVDPRWAERFAEIAREERRRREVCTPVGLRRLFPGLR